MFDYSSQKTPIKVQTSIKSKFKVMTPNISYLTKDAVRMYANTQSIQLEMSLKKTTRERVTVFDKKKIR